MSRLGQVAAIAASSMAVALQLVDHREASGSAATSSTTTPQRRVRVVTEEAVREKSLRTENAVVVPTTAVQVDPDGTHVDVVEDGVAVIKRVEVRRSTAGEAVIQSGVSSGESVVTESHLLLPIEHP